MNIVIDTSVILAVITNEPIKGQLIHATQDAELVAPESIHWEVGSAFSALFRRKLSTLDQAITALEIYKQIPIRLVPVNLASALGLAYRWGIDAYDAYMVECALSFRSPLLTLDRRLAEVADHEGVSVIRIGQ
jgi:predicted nucleic acid-binding protein